MPIREGVRRDPQAEKVKSGICAWCNDQVCAYCDRCESCDEHAPTCPKASR